VQDVLELEEAISSQSTFEMCAAGGAEIAGVDIAGVDIAAPSSRGGHRGSGHWGSSIALRRRIKVSHQNLYSFLAHFWQATFAMRIFYCIW